MSDSPKIRELIPDTIISFLECTLKGTGWKLMDDPISSNEFLIHRLEQDEGNEIALVRPDELVRRFVFQKGSIVRIGSNSIKFRRQDVMDEISIDEDEQSTGISDKNTVFKTWYSQTVNFKTGMETSLTKSNL